MAAERLEQSHKHSEILLSSFPDQEAKVLLTTGFWAASSRSGSTQQSQYFLLIGGCIRTTYEQVVEPGVLCGVVDERSRLSNQSTEHTISIRLFLVPAQVYTRATLRTY
jgi:hypothetical protein